MLIPDSEEVIARFIGMFGMLDFDPRFHSPVAGADRQVHDVKPAPTDAMAWGGLTTTYDPRFQSPQLRYGNDVFELEKVRSHPPATSKFDAHHGAQTFVSGPSSAPHAATDDPHTVAARGHHAPVDPTIAYDDDRADSLLAVYRQNNNLDDRDYLSMDGETDPLSVVHAVTREFLRMVDTAEAWHSVPSVPADTAEIAAKLTIVPAFASALDDHGGETPSGGPAVVAISGDGWTATSMAMVSTHAAGEPLSEPLELQGIFVNGAASATMPALDEILAGFGPKSPEDIAKSVDVAGSTLDTGSNMLTTDTLIRNVGDVGYVTALMGNWYETNSIRQINIHSDIDDIGGFANGGLVSGGTQSMNVAQFNRIDATSIEPAALPNFGFLPSNYRVDVVEGNLQITNFLSQLNFAVDGDRISLTSSRNAYGISTGENDVKINADLLKTLGSYDLVIIGGSVFEGNFIEQINVLSDSDRLLSKMTSPGSDGGVSGSIGGNLLLNAAKITNIGGLGDFVPLTADMSKLISTIANRGTIDDPQIGSDLGFLGHSDIRVLYLTGNVYEMNVVSQMNVLDDADTVLQTGSPGRNFVDAAGPHAAWTISTGKNALVNVATISDVDDAGFKRFMDGHYYSSSMLVQADLVSRGQDIVSFDPNKLVPEVVAFMHDDVAPHGLHDSPHSILLHDASAEGVGSMLS